MKSFLFSAALWCGYALTLSAQCTAGFNTETDLLNPIALTFTPWVLASETLPASDYAAWWDFGDGSTSNEPTPTHSYYCAGFYTTCLTAILLDGCTATDCRELTVGTLIGATCTAAFSASTLDFTDTGNNLSFSDQSVVSEPILTYWWDFGDSITSNEPDPVHWFDNGTHYVCLTIMTGVPGTTSFCIDQHCEYLSVGNEPTPPIVVATPISELLIEPFSITVQPNPMPQEGTLRLQCPIAYDNLDLTIYTSSGVVAWSQSGSYGAGIHVIELAPYRWHKGLYTAVITQNSNLLAILKFIKI